MMRRGGCMVLSCQQPKRSAALLVLLALCCVVLFSPQILLDAVVATRRAVIAVAGSSSEANATVQRPPPQVQQHNGSSLRDEKPSAAAASPGAKQDATEANDWYLDVPTPGEAPMHVLFLGDSIMRYQFLDLAYRLHVPGKRPRARMLYCGCPNWMSFFKTSTEAFNGSMTCDCSRLQPRSVDPVRTLENRFYRHPTSPLFLSYIQLLGEQNLSSRVPLNQTSLASHLAPPVVDVGSTSWHYFQQTLLTVAQTELPAMAPKPTHIVINIGHWDHASLVGGIRTIMEALHNITPYVVWRQTSQPAPGSIGFRSRVAQQSWFAFRHRRQFLDAIVRRELCVREDSNASSEPLRSQLCYFFPLPGGEPGKLIHAYEFSDFLHPHAHWYACWNARLWKLLRLFPTTRWAVDWDDRPLPLDCLSFSQTTLATTDQHTLELLDAAGGTP